MDPEEWLAQYDKRITEVASRAKQAGERLREVGATATSRRGEVEVRVSASGTLEDLTLTPSARALEADELARLILDTTRTARHAVSAQVVGITTRYFGDGPALNVIRQHLPAGAPTHKVHDEDDYFANPEITQ
jgi:DNA-binding protein YbaB